MNSAEKPHERLLVRGAVPQANADLQRRIDHAFRILIDQMTWIQIRCLETRPRHRLSMAPLLLLRHVIEQIDAVHILVMEASTVPAKMHLRSALEAHLYIHFMLERNWEHRAACYAVCSYKWLDKQLEQQRDVSNLGRGVDGTPPPSNLVDRYHSNYAEFFALPEVSEAVGLYNQFIRKAKRPPKWYQLADSRLTNVRQLADAMNYGGRYRLFQSWSEVVHPDHAATQLEGSSDGSRSGMRYLRDAFDLTHVINATYPLAAESTDQVLGFCRPGEVAGFRKWITDVLEPAFNIRVTRQFIDEIDSNPVPGSEVM